MLASRSPTPEDPGIEVTKMSATKNLIERLKLPDTLAKVEERRELVAVAIRKPTRQEWIHVHPELQVEGIALLEIRENSTMFVISGEIVTALGMDPNKGDFAVVDLHLAVTVTGAPFFMPKRHGGDNWAVSAQEVVDLARRTWVRVSSDRSAGHYEAHTAINQLPDPVWPKQSLEELLEMALKTRFIDSPDHDILKRLRGAF